MAIDIELLLTRHPLLLLWRKCCVKCLDSSSALTAVGGGGGDIHPLSAVEYTWNKLCNEQGGREVEQKPLRNLSTSQRLILRSANYRRMTIDIELLLARHPLLFFRWECRVKGFNSSGVFTAVGGGGGNIYPLSAVKCIRHKLTYEKCGREVPVHDEADVFLFTAHETTADIVARIAEIDVYIVTHFACYLKGMLDQYLAELLPLIFGCNAKRSEGEYLLTFAVLVLKPRLCVHNVADDLAVKLKHECKLGNKVGMMSHHVNVIMFVRARLVDVPKRLAGKLFNCSVVFFGL